MHCGEIPRNCSPAHTCGHCCFGCPTGDKQDMTGTYLSDAAGHGARIFTGNDHPAPHPSIIARQWEFGGLLHTYIFMLPIIMPAVVLARAFCKQRDRHESCTYQPACRRI